jgi:hypothetical protein
LRFGMRAWASEARLSDRQNDEDRLFGWGR